MSDNIRPALYDADYSCTLASRAPTRAALVRVVGKHCECGDIVVSDEYLPETRAGDLLAVPATGAYCRSMASNYNYRPRPPVVAVRDGQARVMVRGETRRICWHGTSAGRVEAAERPDAGTMRPRSAHRHDDGVRDSPTGRKEQKVSENGRSESGSP